MHMYPASHFVGRKRTHDNAAAVGRFTTYDARGNHMGEALERSFRTWDGSRTVDSTGAFLVGELERLDQTIHEPLASVSWQRDIDLREDVTEADDVSSFTISTYASSSGTGAGQSIGNGKAWAGKNTTEISNVSIDMAKIGYPLRPWSLELKWSLFELKSAVQAGRPVDDQKYQALKLKHQMDTDEMVYIGDYTTGDTGLLNNGLVTNLANVPNGASSSPLWTQKTPEEILADVNEILQSGWAASGYAVMPSKILMPPTQFGSISTRTISAAGTVSILTYLLENNILKTTLGRKLDIQPCKWNVGAGVGGTIGTTGHDRMVAYTQEKERVRYPTTMLKNVPLQYDGLYQKTTYYCKLGVVEVVYPECLVYRDGI